MAGTGQVLFVQGGGAGAHDEWDHELVETLSRQLWPDYEVRYPRMPDEDEPTYSGWCMAIRREMKALHDGAVVVGHSLGGRDDPRQRARRRASEQGAGGHRAGRRPLRRYRRLAWR
jgi:hypothetical protein